MFPSKSTPLVLFGFLVILALGIGLRLYAFQANTRAYGDVNTIRNSASQYEKVGIVQYPWKLERFKTALNDPLATPAYMHGPSIPFIAGLLSKLTGISDTFITLKILTLTAGIVMLLLSYRLGVVLYRSQTGIIIMALFATSPILIDFSANGSPYIIATAFVLGADIIVSSFNFKRMRDYALIGGLCSLAFLSLQAMLALSAAIILLGLINIKRLSIKGVIIFIVTWLLCYTPALLWYLHYFDRPFISQQINYIATELQLSGIERENFIAHPLSLLTPPLIQNYLGVMWQRLQIYGQNLNFELSLPFVLTGVIAVIWGVWQKPQRNQTMTIVLTRVAYFAITSVGLALLHTRFLVPVVTAFFILIGWGLDRLDIGNRRFLSPIIVCLIIGYSGWAIWSYSTLDTPPTRYYHNEVGINLEYDGAETIGKQLAQFPPATVIGCDDARRAIYYTDSRLVIIGCNAPIDIIENAISDPSLNVRYILYKVEVIERLTGNFPDAKIIAQNDMFAVLDLAPDTE